MNTEKTLAELKERLLRKKRSIQDEINNYPPPIPACDQQFNHLLDQRSIVTKNLRQLESLTKEREIKAFIDSFKLD